MVSAPAPVIEELCDQAALAMLGVKILLHHDGEMNVDWKHEVLQ